MSATPYGSDPYGSAPAPARSLPTGLAVASLVLGILGLLSSPILLGGLLGLVAVILGVVALGKIKRGEAGGRGLALGGIVTGVLAMLVTVLILVTVGSFLANNADEINNLTECLDQANNNQTEIEACQDQFQRQVNP